MCHNQKIDGLQIIAHNPNVREIFNRTQDIKKNLVENFKYKVYLGPNQKCESFINESKFEEQCTLYFERYYESLAQQGPLILPCKVTCDYSRNLGKLTPVMRYWCEKTNNTRTSIRGLVLQSFSVWKHLRWHGFNEEMIKHYLQIDNISEELSTVVYNPQESAVLLLHKAKSEKLETNIASAFDCLKLFMLLFHNVITNMKLIPIVVTDKNVNPNGDDCHDCIKHVLSEKELADFSDWLERRENYFQTGNRNKIREDLSKSFLAKVTGVLAAASIPSNHVPMFIDDQYDNEQMEHVKVLLTPAQIDIFYSNDKHMIIKGRFGCGKSIVAAAMLEKIAQNLKNDEKLFHICYDSRSKLLNKMVKNTHKNYKVTSFQNKDGLLLSAIIDQITKPDRSEKINLVVDECNGEDLDTSEAEKLKKVFNESLKESYIVMIAQPIKKERIISNVRQEKNRFDILEDTMKEYYLKSNRRNSIEIHELAEATKEVLKDKQTVFIHPKDSKTGGKSERNQETEERPEEISISKKESSKHGNQEELEVNSKIGNCGENSISDELEVEPEHEMKGQSVENYGSTKIGLDGAEALYESPMLNRKKNIKSHQELGLEVEHERVWQPIKNYGDSVMGLDEAQAILGSPIEKDTSGNSTRSIFEHGEVDNIGHKIKTERPLLFELGDKEEFQRGLSLVAIFTKLFTISSKHVVLHFDTEPNAIPRDLRFAFDHHFGKKETTNFKEFETSKKVLVCSYPTFRGLEYPRITVLIDRDIYFQQHYLVEMLTRCTSKLFIIVLENSPALKNVLAKWKTEELVNQWKTKISVKKNQTRDIEFSWDDKQRIINGTIKPKYYEHLAKLFKSASIINEITSDIRVHAAQETINQLR